MSDTADGGAGLPALRIFEIGARVLEVQFFNATFVDLSLLRKDSGYEIYIIKRYFILHTNLALFLSVMSSST